MSFLYFVPLAMAMLFGMGWLLVWAAVLLS